MELELDGFIPTFRYSGFCLFKVGKKNGGSKENLNQEDIDAVQFLASEFSKEITTTKPTDGKTTIEIETVDGNMIEVAAIQGVIASVPDSEEQDEAVARLTAEIRVFYCII